MRVEHFDVIVVGAGISGIGAAYHLQTNCPGRTYAILEGRPDIGGTWDLFRYPGVRSDSDMHTLGYSFKPWTDSKSIADGPSILSYLRETVAEYGIDRHIRFNHLVSKAEWSTDEARWTITARRTDTDETVSITCGYLFMCSGYYSYRGGYTPDFPGIENFAGQVVHPQAWPDDLDYAGKKVVVIGSGATAVTLVPAMAADTEHITMLQRSPTYVVSRPDQDAIANKLRKVLPDGLAYDITRFKNTTLQQVMYKRMRARPEQSKEQLLKMVRSEMGDEYDVDTHFTPTYFPWDQRLCLVPNSDLFQAIKSGKASVVTDTIDTFTVDGDQADVGSRTRSRHRRDRDRVAARDPRRDGLRGRRHSCRFLEDVDLQGLRLLRRAEPRLVVRVHQRVVDPARRPDLRVRVPAAQPHGGDGDGAVHAAPARLRRRHARA